MPGYDRTGPMGSGAMTGWGAGRCGGNRMQPAQAGGWGGGFGGGRGRWCAGPGRGRRGRFAGRGYGYGNASAYPMTSPVLQADPESEKRFLQSQANLMSDQLEEIRRRLNELEGKDAE